MNLFPLKAGDIIDVVAPASGSDPDIVSEINQVVSALGFVANIPQDIFPKNSDPFSSNTVGARFNHLKNALLNKNSKAIWCAKGGYGSAQLIPLLNKMPVPKIRKVLIGFSDITALHLFFNQKWGWPTIHGKVLFQFCPGYLLKDVQNKKEEDLSYIAPSMIEMKKILLGKNSVIDFSDLVPMNDFATQNGVINSSVIGGNMSIVQTSIGTIWQLNSKNKIVFLEEVDEKGYRIDRMLDHYLQSGILNGALAIIFGDITGGLEKGGYSLASLAIERFAHKIGVPVFSCRDIGHGKINHPLPFGTPSTIHLGNNPKLSCKAIGY